MAPLCPNYCFPALWLIALPAVLATRCLTNTFLRNVGLEQCRILSVGTAHGLKQIDLAVESDPTRGYRVVATFNLEAMASLTRLTENHLLDGIHNALRAAKADFALLSLWDCDDWFRNAVIAELIREVIPFGLVPDFGDVSIYRCSVNHHVPRAPIMLIINDRIPYTFAGVIKEVLDRTIALVAVVALLPVFLSVAVAVACDGSPVLYRQTRIGQNGRRFQFLKFRSMYVGAGARLAALLAENEAAAAEWERHQKLRYDPRVTPVGRFIRKTSLDELPQLFNVLKGGDEFRRPPACLGCRSRSVWSRSRPVLHVQTGYYWPLADQRPKRYRLSSTRGARYLVFQKLDPLA